MHHIYKQGTDNSKPVLLLLHGTGGDEHDLLPLAEKIDPASSVLSVKGNVLENGMPRFFKRLAEGVFYEEDLIYRTKELNDFLQEAAEKYGFERDNIVALGYSNGANIAVSLLFHYGPVLKGAILHHPMVPRRGIDLPVLVGVPIFIGAGINDPICPASESEDLRGMLERAGARVHLHWENHGHQLTYGEVERASAWYKENFND